MMRVGELVTVLGIYIKTTRRHIESIVQFIVFHHPLLHPPFDLFFLNYCHGTRGVRVLKRRGFKGEEYINNPISKCRR